MTRFVVIGEDDLTCALGERIAATLLPGWSAAASPIRAGGISKLIASLQRYNRFATNLAHVLCVADSDGLCPVTLLSNWFPNGHSERFLMRLAVVEAESWALGDRHAIADFFQVPLNVIPHAPDELTDPKRELLRIVSRSRARRFREEMILPSSGMGRPGAGYNVHLRRFVESRWDATQAEQNSPSLRRAMNRVRALV